MTQPNLMERFRSLPDLNFDILLQVLSLLTAQDVASLTRTCRALRVALSAELPRGEVTLEGRRLTSFLAFASVTDGRDRLSYLHKLVLPGSTYGESLSGAGERAMSMKDVERALPKLFQLASHNLDSLAILDLDVFSFRPPELKSMLDSLPRIRDLEMSGVEKKYQNALTDTLPRLHTLTLAFYADDTDIGPFLRTPHRAPDLQSVTLYNGTLPAADPEDARLAFPTVHTLRVCPRRLPCDVDACMRLFPNVRHATLDFPEGYGTLTPAFRKDMRSYHPGMAWSDSSVQAWRARFLSHVQDTRGPDGAWPHLQSVRAAGHDAWNLGWAGLAPGSGVARVEMTCAQWSWKDQVPGTKSQLMLTGVLNELRPRCVVFHPSAFDSPYTRRIFRWPQLLALQDAPGVTRLAMVFCGMVGRGYVCKAVWARQLREVLAKTAVSCLLIRLDYACPASQERTDLFEKWRAGLLQGTFSLRAVLFQVQDEAVVGWVKNHRALGDWKEMDEGAKREFLASEDICPASVEPCEWCGRRVRGS